MHHSNLCRLPQSEQQAIEVSKQRWFRAYQMVRSMTIEQIKVELEAMPDDERLDMRLKLNTCYPKRFQK